MTTQNEAAEQIRFRFGDRRVTQHPPSSEASPLLTDVLAEALAAERRATVERIRAELARDFGESDYVWPAIAHILDEEAARDTQLSRTPDTVKP